MAPPPNPYKVTSGPDYSANALCPACAYRGSTIIVSKSDDSVGLFFIYILFCLSCACCLLGDTRDRGLLYYCERCGLRLVTDDNKGSQMQYDSSTLMPKPEEMKGGQATPGSKVARSPLGLPLPMNRPAIVNIKARYEALTPVRKLVIETGRFGLPTKVTDPSTTSGPTYVIESPGIPPEDPNAKKKERQFLQYHCAWALGSGVSRQTPHFRVNSLVDGTSRELAWVKLFGGSNWDAEIHVAASELTDDKKSFVERRIFAVEESDWSTSGPGVLWTSSEGLLLWSMRTLRDAEGVNTRALCLLDAYDRLVVALRKIRLPEGGGKAWEMRVYADVSERFMGEILASYTALRCQQERIVQQHIYDSS